MDLFYIASQTSWEQLPSFERPDFLKPFHGGDNYVHKKVGKSWSLNITFSIHLDKLHQLDFIILLMIKFTT